MSIKTTTFISAHYPNTYMEQFCRSIHPDLELGPVCVSWFRQATKHCTELITNVKAPGAYFWTTVKNFIFPDIHTDLMSQNIPIKIHYNQLSMQDCQSLFLDIVNDYVLRAPRYAAESTTNAMLWQVLYSLMGIIVLGSMLLGVMVMYKRTGRSTVLDHVFQDVFHPQKRLEVVANRSLRMAKAEVRSLQVIPMVQPEELIAPDGSVVLALKVNSNFELLGSIVSSSMKSTGRLFRTYDQNSKTKPDYKVQTINKALQFVGNSCKKLRLLIIFENDAYVDCMEQTKSKEESKKIATPKSWVLPKNRILLNCNKIETLESSRQRIAGNPNKFSSDVAGDTGSPRYGATLQKQFNLMTSKSLRSESPKNSASPRSGTVIHSGIPRSAARYSPTTKK